MGRGGWAPWVAVVWVWVWVWVSSLPAARSQYLKTSKDELVVEKYYEVQEKGTKDLENLLGDHLGCPSALPTYLRTTTAACYPYLNEKYNPQDGVLLEAEFKPFADIDQYSVEEPRSEDYQVGLLLDPCQQLSYDCCVNTYGTAEYGALPADTSTETLYDTERRVTKRRLAGSDGILENFDSVIKYDHSVVELEASRRADDAKLVADECVGVEDPYPYCQGYRLRNQMFPTYPNCTDNNQTVFANRTCQDVNGEYSDHCVQLGYSQTALAVICGGGFSDNEHCGTFFEVHMPNGSPYNDETYVINDVRLEQTNASGFNTTTLPLFYGVDGHVADSDGYTRVLCNYEENRLREGSMVFVKSSAPKCCCPQIYSDSDYQGHFFCPRNTEKSFVVDGYEGGPFADSVLGTLAEQMENDIDIDTYPYCPVTDEHEDIMMCSKVTNVITEFANTDDDDVDPWSPARLISESVYTASGVYSSNSKLRGNRFYTEPCPDIYLRNGSDAKSNMYTSDALRGSYKKTCPYFDTCATPAVGVECNASASGEAFDTEFTFAGFVGKVTYVPTDPADDEFVVQYKVSFNDGRTEYDFAEADLVLEKEGFNYEVWWVERTRYNYIVRKKKPFRVVSPECTFDRANDQYLPFALIDEDGVPLDSVSSSGYSPTDDWEGTKNT